MTNFQHAFRPLLGVMAAGLVLAGCMQPTPYAPRTEGTRTGYTDRALTENRYRVTFTGNTVTPRETVESYLLLRSAEVARAAGYSFFVFDTRNTRAHTSYQVVPPMPAPDPWWGYRRGFGYWGGYGWAYDPGMDVITRTNYQAYAEIVLLTPEQAKNEPRAIRADDVLAHIGPDAIKPPATPPA
jgi:hypothetical protein